MCSWSWCSKVVTHYISIYFHVPFDHHVWESIGCICHYRLKFVYVILYNVKHHFFTFWILKMKIILSVLTCSYCDSIPPSYHKWPKKCLLVVCTDGIQRFTENSSITIECKQHGSHVQMIFTIESRPTDKCAQLKSTILIFQPKHTLWVLKRTVSMRRFF